MRYTSGIDTNAETKSETMFLQAAAFQQVNLLRFPGDLHIVGDEDDTPALFVLPAQ